ncbi:unnamed protein product [Miscanthus lutarioriparius]|uniref:HAT C-terminal dimerisation domain-containing protein n=1 Tax=Miscanthus lutarioriparius TaxID=422564 RepID=A0A811QTA1_9POAL|nr:unnamed protein product [Miscanthus lutarioriparius]
MRRFCHVPRGRRPAAAPHDHQPLPPPEWIDPYPDLADPSPYASASAAPPTPSPWLPRVISLVLRSPPATLAADLRAFCRTFLLRLSPAFVAAALRSPQLTPHPLPSLHFFRSLPNGADLLAHPQHLLSCYVSLLHSFARSRETASPNTAGQARQLVADLRAHGDAVLRHLAPASSASLIRSLAAFGLSEELLWAWQAMRLAGVEPSRLTYNCLLDGLVNAGLLDTAINVFDAMSTEDRVRPDVVSYNILIKGYCRAGRTQDAMARLADMREQAELAPDKVTYLTLMQRHYSEGTFPQCIALFQEMEERGMGKEIPQHAYVLVIGALSKDGKPFEALAVFERMLKRGCPANAAMYTALIDSMGKFGREKEAMALFERMKASGVELDTVTYGVVVNCLCRFGNMDEALACFRSCVEKGVAVNAIFYTSLIDGFGKAGMVDQAKELFEEMIAKGFVPDSYCYNVLIDALVKAGRTDDACAFYKRMEDDGCDQTVYTYTILIDGLFKEHKNEEALKFWDSMIDKGITPTAAAFRVLANGLCLSGKFSRAWRILDELAPMGVIPETAHEDMINVLCKTGRFKQACKLADGIVQKGREIPGRVRTMMINALRKAGNTDLAFKLVHRGKQEIPFWHLNWCIVNEMIEVDEEDDQQSEEDEGEQQEKQKNKKRKAIAPSSDIWDHFTKHAHNLLYPLEEQPLELVSKCDVQKEKLKKFLKEHCGRVSLATDTWTSNTNQNYMCVTAHFIDNDWKVHKKIIGFFLVESHRGEDIGKSLENCLAAWGIDKVFTITVDDDSANNDAIKYMRRVLNESNGSIAKGEYLHMRCVAHIVNLIVSEGLKEIDRSVVRVRAAVKFVKGETSRLARFKKCAELAKVQTKAFLTVDVCTRWNSTCLMLNTAQQYEKAFEMYSDEDPYYKLDLNDEKDGPGVPEKSDWDNARKMAWCDSEDRLCSEMGKRMLVKYYKYFGEKYGERLGDGEKRGEKDKGDQLLNLNFVVYFCVAIDPRYKLSTYIKMAMMILFGDEIGEKLWETVNTSFHALFEEYRNMYAPSDNAPQQPTETQEPPPESRRSFKSIIAEKLRKRGGANATTKSELDKYFSEDNEEDNEGFDILKYWKGNAKRFPILSRMACDLLAIPISTVASESAFSTGGRVLDDFRSSLTPPMVERLICASDWIRGSNIVSVEENEEELYKLEEELGALTIPKETTES